MLVRKLILALLWTSIAMIEILFISCCLRAQVVRRGEEMGKPPKLEIELQLFKTQYLLREPIWARCKVTNVGTEPGKFYFDNLDALVIMDSKGKVYPCSMAIERVPITIKPGQTLEKEGNLFTYYYGIPENKFKIHRYLPLEKYSIYYELDQSVGSDNYRVKAKSKPYTFDVLNPEGNELKAMNLLKESYDLLVEKKNNWPKSLEKLIELTTNYPKSRYLPHALLEIASTYKIHMKDSAKTLETYQKIIQNYPESREAVMVLSYLVHYYKTKPDIPGLINYLNDLIKKHPDTEVAKEAKKELAKIKE